MYLQSQNERLREKLSSLENKVISLETSQNMLDQCGRRNNIEISSIPDSAEQSSLEEKVASVFSNVGVDVTSKDTEACHQIGKAETIKKKQLFDLPIENLTKKLFTRKKLKSIDKSSLGLNNNNIVINENITPVNNKIADNCRKLKRNNSISKTYTVNGTVHLIIDKIKNEKPLKVLHMKSLFNYFPILN